MRGMARIAIVVLGLALIAVAVPAGAAAQGAKGPEETLTLFLHAPGHEYRHVLDLKVLAWQGAVTVLTEESDVEVENNGGVAYAMRIPKGPLGDRLNIRLPGLGRVVGRILRPKSGSQGGCFRGEEREDDTFVGQIEFRGSGGYGRWRAHRAEATITRACGEGAPGVPKPPKSAFGYSAEDGPLFAGGSNGPASFLEAIDARGHDTGVVFSAEVVGRGPEETVGFVAIDFEWLHGGIAVKRWIQRRGLPRGDLFEIASGGRRPPSATIRPPAPFSGEATYSRKGDTFLGDLSVHLLGKTVRIAGGNTRAALANST
jgi:hypothetical protein